MCTPPVRCSFATSASNTPFAVFHDKLALTDQKLILLISLLLRRFWRRSPSVRGEAGACLAKFVGESGAEGLDPFAFEAPFAKEFCESGVLT